MFQLKNNHQNLTDENLLVEIHTDSAYRTEILTGGVEVIEKVFAEWTSLCEEGASNEPFFRPEWFAAFVKNFELEIVLLTVICGGKLRAVLPLMRQKATLHGVPARKLQGVSNLNTQRFDLIHGADETERKEIIAVLWKEIKKQKRWNVLEMRLVKTDSWLNDLLEFAEADNFKTGVWQMDSAPFVTLPQGDDKEYLVKKYFNELSQNRRKKIKKKMRQLKEIGNVEIVVTRGYRADLLQTYFDLESKGWKGRGGTAVTDDPQVAGLHDDFARAVAAKNALIIYEIKLNDITIAMYISIMYDRQTIGWKTSYDEKYAFYSPGNLIEWEVLCGCIRNGSPELDQLSPATYNKSLWSSGEYGHAAFYIFQRGIIGSLLWNWKFSVISRLRKLKK